VRIDEITLSVVSWNCIFCISPPVSLPELQHLAHCTIGDVRDFQKEQRRTVLCVLLWDSSRTKCLFTKIFPRSWWLMLSRSSLTQDASVLYSQVPSDKSNAKRLEKAQRGVQLSKVSHLELKTTCQLAKGSKHSRFLPARWVWRGIVAHICLVCCL
jgi:hypothetical protein